MSTKPIMVDTIYERFTGFFDMPDKCIPFVLSEPCTLNDFFNEDIKESGFPDVLDLSAYWSIEKNNTNEHIALKDVIKLETSKNKNKSLFSQAFDEINLAQKNSNKKGLKFK